MEFEDFPNKYRPKTFTDVVGQAKAVKLLSGHIENHTLPRLLIFQGPSGCGKTTLARIAAREVGAKGTDLISIDAAKDNTVPVAKSISNKVRSHPLVSKVRVFLIDEAHILTKQAQNVLLTPCEDASKVSHIFMCTTQPKDIISTLHTRATKIGVDSISENDIYKLLVKVVVAENAQNKTNENVAKKIASKCEGSARKALVLLSNALCFDNEQEQLASVDEVPEDEKNAYELVKAIFNSDWQTAADILGNFNTPIESARQLILNYAAKVILPKKEWKTNKSQKAFKVIECFKYNFFESGKAGFHAATYRACHEKG